MTSKEEFLQKVRALVEGSYDNLAVHGDQPYTFVVNCDGIDELVAKIGDLFEAVREEYGLFNLLAPGYSLDPDDALAKGLWCVPKDKHYLFNVPFRTIGSYIQALRALGEVRARREANLDRVHGYGGVEMRKRIILATKWEEVNEDAGS